MDQTFLLKRLLPGLFFKSDYTVCEHCIYSYFTVIFINDLQKKPYDQDQQRAFPSLQTVQYRKDKGKQLFVCKGCQVVLFQ